MHNSTVLFVLKTEGTGTSARLCQGVLLSLLCQSYLTAVPGTVLGTIMYSLLTGLGPRSVFILGDVSLISSERGMGPFVVPQITPRGLRIREEIITIEQNGSS